MKTIWLAVVLVLVVWASAFFGNSLTLGWVSFLIGGIATMAIMFVRGKTFGRAVVVSAAVACMVGYWDLGTSFVTNIPAVDVLKIVMGMVILRTVVRGFTSGIKSVPKSLTEQHYYEALLEGRANRTAINISTLAIYFLIALPYPTAVLSGAAVISTIFAVIVPMGLSIEANNEYHRALLVK